MNKAALGIILICIVSACNNGGGKSSGAEETFNKEFYAARVKEEFLHCWQGYKKYAWGHDEVKPLSKSYRDWYGKSILMTPLDAFSTMKIMELDEEADEAKALIFETLSYDFDADVQLFEINIRSLGSLLSAYQMDGDAGFLALAEDLAGRLLPAFDSPTGMPYRYVNLQSGKTKDPLNNPAEIGTLMLEWGTLSRITGNPVYYQKAKQAVQAVFAARSKFDLVGTVIDVESGKWVDTETHISARIDSYYEYLLKSWLMFGDAEMKHMWEVSIEAINKYLADERDGGLWYGRADMNNTEIARTYFGALDAFFPAVLVLGGDVQRAIKLQNSSYKMWKLYDIEPEVINYATMDVIAENYVLRPENIESVYYLYVHTKNPKYLEMGNEYFDSLVEYCRNDVAYAHLKSVKTKEQQDAMESFFLAETLKYFYLLFAPEDTIDFDKIIFNTEAHPLKRWNSR
jgi:mannosidase alpha-like ER degradation enhancer 2